MKDTKLGGSGLERRGMPTSQPAWQTEELQDEWPDEGHSGDDLHTRSISLTVPVGPQALTSSLPVGDVNVPGTFLIRQDVLSALPQKTPGQRKGLIKDFFSPIPLECMFDPPSPGRDSSHTILNPPTHGRLSHHVPPSIVPATSSRVTSQNSNPSEVAAFDGWRPNMHCPFTFTAPDSAPSPRVTSPGFTRTKSTPSTATSVIPSVEPPLRLFQFQYDTFTRDHLSAMVDSIAINSPSGSNAGNLAANSSPFGLPTVSEASAPFSSIELRSAKRVKLSPVSDFDDPENGRSCDMRSLLCRKDYVGESRSLMARIKSTRDISIFSTPVSIATHSDATYDSSGKMGVQGECESILAGVSSVSPISWKLFLPSMTFTHLRRTKIQLQLHTKGRLIPLWVTGNKQRA